VAAALDGSAYRGAPNGRVREVPAPRAIRWYTTIGLVDRPFMRGKVALYGPRHLLQLVAIKRRQSQGWRIADIQVELAKAPDEVLWGIANLSPDVFADSPMTPSERLAHIAVDMEDVTNPAVLFMRDNLDDNLDGSPEAPRRRFWTDPPTEHQTPPDDQTAPEDHPQLEDQAQHQAHPEPQRPGDALLSGVPLGGGAVLLLPATPTNEDLPEIHAAARELLELLAARGLTTDRTKSNRTRQGVANETRDDDRRRGAGGRRAQR
jgi:DNA-binding transcriptional MerR regulator